MAIQIIRDVAADVIKRGVTKAVYAKQNDFNSRFLNVRIQADGKDLVVSPTATVLLNVERSDKKEDVFKGTVNEDGTVQVPMTAWMLELAGTLLCDISIVSADPLEAKLTTMQFNIYVEAAVVSDGSISDSTDYSLILDLIKRAEELEANAPGIHIGPEAPERGGQIWIDTDVEGTEINVVAKAGQVIAVEEVDEDGMPTKLKAVDLDKVVAPDLGANEGEPGYVKGRTHYIDEKGVVHKIPNKFIDADWMATSESVGGGIEFNASVKVENKMYLLGINNQSIHVNVGVEYDVYWGTVKYVCTPFEASGELFMGNADLQSYESVKENPFSNKNAPFLFSGSNDTLTMIMTKSLVSGTIDIRVETHAVTVYNKLPKEYLPDDIGGVNVTAEVGQTIVVEEVDGSGKPTKWRAADYQPRTHWSEEGLVQVSFYPYYTTRLNSTYGFFTFGITFNGYVESLPLTSISSIVYDGVEYTGLATVELQGSRFFGNLYFLNDLFGTSFGYTGEPFLLTGDSTGMMMFTLDQQATVHSVQIYSNGTEYHRIDRRYAPKLPVIDIAHYQKATDTDRYFGIEGNTYYNEVYNVLRNNEIVKIMYIDSQGRISTVCGFPQVKAGVGNIFVYCRLDDNQYLKIDATPNEADIYID